MFIAVFSTFHMTFVQISDFDWLPGLQKGKFSKKKKRKKMLLSSQKSYYGCIHIYGVDTLHKLCVMFWWNKNTDILFLVMAFGIFFQKCLHKL